MTEATIKALNGMRDLAMIKWYVIPLIAFVFYIYTSEIKKARESGNWNAIFSGLTIFGVDFFNETWNGWVMVLTKLSAFWTAPGDTALRTMIGWNIEIMMMFFILGIVFYNSLSKSTEEKIFGFSEKWVLAVVYSAICVLVEIFLNLGGHLVWEYSFWNRSFGGIWLIFLLGYFHFFVFAIVMINLKTISGKLKMLAIVYTVPILMNIFGFGIMGWNY
ncbi:MAG: hypothetical protein IT569_00350 [Leptospiraceae bacterium]|nr:hypothetical protein [Leptospiraceae bacterium]